MENLEWKGDNPTRGNLKSQYLTALFPPWLLEDQHSMLAAFNSYLLLPSVYARSKIPGTETRKREEHVCVCSSVSFLAYWSDERSEDREVETILHVRGSLDSLNTFVPKLGF